MKFTLCAQGCFIIFALVVWSEASQPGRSRKHWLEIVMCNMQADEGHLLPISMTANLMTQVEDCNMHADGRYLRLSSLIADFIGLCQTWKKEGK